jgi:transcriptional regulator with XRE-family HTH domain
LREDHEKSYSRLLEEERLILDASETIHRLMDERDVTRVELARRVGATKGHISQLLDGKRNMTLRTLARLMDALGHRARIETEPLARRASLSRPTMTHKVPAYVNSTRACASIDIVKRLEGAGGSRLIGVHALEATEGFTDLDRELADLLAGAA